MLPPIITMVMRKVYLRPTMSPIRPNMIAPIGRMTKPAASAPSEASSAAVGLSGGNSTELMNTASEP